MLKHILNLMKRQGIRGEAAPGEDRPVKFVQEKENIWRVVYADEPSGKA